MLAVITEMGFFFMVACLYIVQLRNGSSPQMEASKNKMTVTADTPSNCDSSFPSLHGPEQCQIHYDKDF